MLKESQVKTEQFNQATRNWLNIRVFYTDELIETSAFDLIFTAGMILPYLFVGYFTDKEGNSRWFFSNAARHLDMKHSVEESIGEAQRYEYGQLWIDTERMKNGDGNLSFSLLTLQSDFPERENAISSLKNVVKPEYFNDRFVVHTP